jgi:hypothetical protein
MLVQKEKMNVRGDSNVFDDDSDSNIRKDIVQRMDDEKKIEEQIKTDLENLQRWFEIESKILEEKQKILKKCYDELRLQKSLKFQQLRLLHGGSNCEKIKRKFNVRL